MAPRAAEFLAKERLRDDVGLGGHGSIVERGLRESGGAAVHETAFHFDKFGGDAIERDVVRERLMQPPAKRAWYC